MRKISCFTLLPGVAAALTVPIALAQNPPAAFLTPPSGETALQPKIACQALRNLTNYDFSVESATLIPASGENPERCRVRGQILPEIQFEVNLPATWNRRFYMFGNGGYAGESLDMPNRTAQRVAAVRRGFAVADTNTGHDAADEPLGTFAQNRQKLLDYAFRSLHVTAIALWGRPTRSPIFGSPPKFGANRPENRWTCGTSP